MDLPRFVRALNEVYRSLGSPATADARPAAVLDLRLPPDAYDINLAPDKRQVALHDEPVLLQGFQEALRAHYEPSRFTFTPNGAAKPGLDGGVRLESSAQRAKRAKLSQEDGGGSQADALKDEDDEEEEEAGEDVRDAYVQPQHRASCGLSETPSCDLRATPGLRQVSQGTPPSTTGRSALLASFALPGSQPSSSPEKRTSTEPPAQQASRAGTTPPLTSMGFVRIAKSVDFGDTGRRKSAEEAGGRLASEMREVDMDSADAQLDNKALATSDQPDTGPTRGQWRWSVSQEDQAMQDPPEQEAGPEVAAARIVSEDAATDACEMHAQHLPPAEDAELDDDDGDELPSASQQQEEEEEYAAPAAPHPGLHEQATTLRVDLEALWRQACETHLEDQEDESGAEALDLASLARRSRYRAASMAPSLGARSQDDKTGPKTDGQPNAAAGAKGAVDGWRSCCVGTRGTGCIGSDSNLHPCHLSYFPLRRARTGPCV